MSSNKSTLRVGSADDVDIVIKQATVSRYHCELQWNNGAWELHDLKSTNGTFVDGERITEATRLSPANVVTLGRGIPLEIPAAPKAAATRAEPKPRKSTRESLPTGTLTTGTLPTGAQPARVVSANKWIYVLATAGVMSLLGAILLVVLNSGGNKGDDSDASNDLKIAATAPEENAVAPEKSSSSNGNGEGPRNSVQDPNLKASAASESVLQSDPAFWAVLAESSNGKSQKLLGTAVAIGPNRLITLASIVEALEAVKATYPRLVLAQPANPSKRLSPAKVDIHPSNIAAVARYKDFEKRLADRINSETELKEPGLEESLDWSKQAETIVADIAKSDLACLSIQETLKKFLPIGKDPISNQATDCMLRGFPLFAQNPPEIQSNLSVFYLDLPANYKMDTRLKQPIPLVESSDFEGIAMISMVCLNQKSEVVGLCVREEPVQDLAAPKRGQIVVVEAFW